MTGGKLLRLERMIPAYGITVKHKFPYACLFRNSERWGGDWIMVVKYNSNEENCTFGPKSTISWEPATGGMAPSIEEKIEKIHF